MVYGRTTGEIRFVKLQLYLGASFSYMILDCDSPRFFVHIMSKLEKDWESNASAPGRAQ